MVEKSHSAGFWPSLYEPFRGLGARMADWFAPASEASVGEDGYSIRMELPGVEEKDVKVSLADGVVTVRGEKQSSREEKGETWYFSEREYGAFSRSFRLPPDADAGAVKADLKDGVLTVSIGKKASDETAGSTEIPIGRG
ncbi:Hsp20/alpha crystallin family protein [Rhodovulum tesquicola]|uniref:Hsp20/alpha crystallin family protein n=1 Tax=Rhodovulum tesquicola TaxID=540254 RepID=UPI002097DFBD|nr:Hsp20/alpha crystallin family protein [Rhodovulum tesquicola]MCO8144201.1 Hsp20/alpha crystallin family protein [Rhodovulum tesquicola]